VVILLTPKEQRVIFWIVLLLLVGYGVKHYRLSHPAVPEKATTLP